MGRSIYCVSDDWLCPVPTVLNEKQHAFRSGITCPHLQLAQPVCIDKGYILVSCWQLWLGGGGGERVDMKYFGELSGPQDVLMFTGGGLCKPVEQFYLKYVYGTTAQWEQGKSSFHAFKGGRENVPCTHGSPWNTLPSWNITDTLHCHFPNTTNMFISMIR